jgi:hypothetical protein
MKGARCHVQSEPLLKKPRDIAIGLSLAAQFADPLSMGFRLRAWRLGREVGKPSNNNLRVCVRGGRKRMHRYPAGRPNRRLATMSRSLGGSLGDIRWATRKSVPIKSPIPGFQPFPGVSQGFHSCPVVRYLSKSRVAHHNPIPPLKRSPASWSGSPKARDQHTDLAIGVLCHIAIRFG